jgi:hypothetical protein
MQNVRLKAIVSVAKVRVSSDGYQSAHFHMMLHRRVELHVNSFDTEARSS